MHLVCTVLCYAGCVAALVVLPIIIAPSSTYLAHQENKAMLLQDIMQHVRDADIDVDIIQHVSNQPDQTHSGQDDSVEITRSTDENPDQHQQTTTRTPLHEVSNAASLPITRMIAQQMTKQCLSTWPGPFNSAYQGGIWRDSLLNYRCAAMLSAFCEVNAKLQHASAPGKLQHSGQKFCEPWFYLLCKSFMCFPHSYMLGLAKTSLGYSAVSRQLCVNHLCRFDWVA